MVLTSLIHELACVNTPSNDLSRDIRHSWRALASWIRFDDSSEILRCGEVVDGWKEKDKFSIGRFLFHFSTVSEKLCNLVLKVYFPVK